MDESRLIVDKHLLICFEVQTHDDKLIKEFDHLKASFCGKVIIDTSTLPNLSSDSVIYFCGDVKKYVAQNPTILDRHTTYILKELSHDYEQHRAKISIGELPLNVHDVGVFFKNYFASEQCYFDLLETAHKFQALTESNKTGTSYRKGVYLSRVIEDHAKTALIFNLLRCSTNFQGPTLRFADVDESIIDKVNDTVKLLFSNSAPLNHVLAQIYENFGRDAQGNSKEKKARISPHSDKTKDMPRNGLIAFGTFYSRSLDDVSKPSKEDLFDRVYKETSVLTRLRFRLKGCVKDRPDLQKEFYVNLYPDSLFIIPLSTNRLFTHEIIPSHLPVDKLPTRLGYVIRCSNAEAVHRDGITYIKNGNEDIKLEEPTEKDREQLKDLYYRENLTADVIEYPHLNYSVNSGDYTKPFI